MTATADQPTPMPTPKWIAGISTGTLTLGVLALARRYGLDLPPEVGEAIVLGAAGLAGWIKRNRAALVECLDDEPGQHAADR
jgi:hypothetical protein